MTEYPLSDRSVAVAFDGKNIWVAHYDLTAVAKIDTRGQVVGTYDVPRTPIELLFDGSNLWVAHFEENIVTKMGRDGKQLGTYKTGRSPGGMFADDRNLLVANGMSDSISDLPGRTAAPWANTPSATAPFPWSMTAMPFGWPTTTGTPSASSPRTDRSWPPIQRMPTRPPSPWTARTSGSCRWAWTRSPG